MKMKRSEKETVKLKTQACIFSAWNDEEAFAELDRKLANPADPGIQGLLYIRTQKTGKLHVPRLRVCCIGRKFEGWHMNVSSEENEIAAVLEDGLKKRKDCHSGSRSQCGGRLFGYPFLHAVPEAIQRQNRRPDQEMLPAGVSPRGTACFG